MIYIILAENQNETISESILLNYPIQSFELHDRTFNSDPGFLNTMCRSDRVKSN